MIYGSNYPFNTPYVRDDVLKERESAIASFIKTYLERTGANIKDIELTQRVETIKTENGLAEEITWSIRERVK